MKQEFVPHELALELKRLGFDEPCLAFYNGKFLDSTQYDFDNCSMKDIGQCLLAPTYSQAFRWFRDNHKHNGIVEGCKKYGFEWCIYPDPEHYIKPPNNFNTYEEAELACLTRLIEIVKSNTNEK